MVPATASATFLRSRASAHPQAGSLPSISESRSLPSNSSAFRSSDHGVWVCDAVRLGVFVIRLEVHRVVVRVCQVATRVRQLATEERRWDAAADAAGTIRSCGGSRESRAVRRTTEATGERRAGQARRGRGGGHRGVGWGLCVMQSVWVCAAELCCVLGAIRIPRGSGRVRWVRWPSLSVRRCWSFSALSGSVASPAAGVVSGAAPPACWWPALTGRVRRWARRGRRSRAGAEKQSIRQVYVGRRNRQSLTCMCDGG